LFGLRSFLLAMAALVATRHDIVVAVELNNNAAKVDVPFH